MFTTSTSLSPYFTVFECLCDRKCFDNQTGHDYTGLYDCLEPKTQLDYSNDLTTYIFVSRAPINGCIKTAQSNTESQRSSCNPDVMAAPWGNFYPVYSFDKQTNFINENCAKCHGAMEIIKWKAFILYSGIKSTLPRTIRNYHQTFNNKDIFILFEPPNKASKEYKSKCFFYKDSCPSFNREIFFVPSHVNMSRSEIVNGCEKGQSSLYIGDSKHSFKNIFCAICDGKISKAFDSVQCTVSLDDSGIRTMTGITLVMLLDDNYLESLLHRPEKHLPISGQVACLPGTNKSEAVVCRELICPTFQVRFPDGKCDYPITSIFADFVTVSVNLTSPDDVDRQHLLNLTADQVISLLNRFSPLPACWKIRLIGLRADIYAINRTEFLVTISCRPSAKRISIQKYVKTLLSTLSKRWVLDVNDRKDFFVEIYPKDDFIVNGRDMAPLWTRRYNTSLNLFGLQIPVWTALFKDDYFYRGLGRSKNIQHIDKLFICDQVELPEDEYQKIEESTLLYLIRNEKYLFPGEFIEYVREDGIQAVTICLEDSGFVQVGSWNRGPSFKQRLTFQCLSFALSVVGMLLISYL